MVHGITKISYLNAVYMPVHSVCVRRKNICLVEELANPHQDVYRMPCLFPLYSHRRRGILPRLK